LNLPSSKTISDLLFNVQTAAISLIEATFSYKSLFSFKT